ncbi:phosphomannomutase/phosphoglucomutase [Tistrella mobilis]|uniref:phosphoglucomutase/phosphomannomutase PgmG n=1 Tax=Tistrella mobilis TaxID=171437 RepID=UPI0031F6F067
MTKLVHRFHPTVLREYDIRGIIGETLGTEDAYAIGRVFAYMLKARGGASAAVGRDGRVSSPDLEAALVRGLTEGGVDVIRVGLGPTPMLYYAAQTRGVDGGIMVTGSHNPPDQNGFKMVMLGKPFFGEDIREMGRIAAEGELLPAPATGADNDAPDVLSAYVARLTEGLFKTVAREPVVVWDAGNGAAGEALTMVARNLPGRHVLLYADIDGTFPNHHPDPTEPHTLVDLIAKVAEEGADLGIAFDGDGDRIGVVDGKGRILWGDQLLMILARPIIDRIPGATIIADVKASQALFDEIARLGGTPVMWKTGHSLIKTKMKETASPLAGEMSGHVFFADGYYGYDDALYAAVRLLDQLATTGESITAIRDGLPDMVNTPEIRIPCADDRKFQVVADIAATLAAEGAQVDRTDGVRVKVDGGWWLLRASNTQAVLVARAEAADDARLAALKGELARVLTAAGVEVPAALAV